MSLNGTILHLLLASTASDALNKNGNHAIPHMVNSSLIIEIVSGLHQRLEFRNFVFYISKRLYRNSETASMFFRDFLQVFPLTPLIIIMENPDLLVGLLSTPCLCFVMTSEWNDPVLELAATSLRGIRYLKTMFLLYSLRQADDELSIVESIEFYEHLRLLYAWVWKRQFLNSLLITLHNNIYLYDPFPTGTLLNKTGNWSLEDFFRNDLLNLKGFEITTPVHFDLPGVFVLRRSPNKSRVKKLTGSAGKLFEAFVEDINGTFNDQIIQDHEFDPFNITHVMKRLESQQLEISVHSYTSMKSDNVGTSYPIGINDWCLMVPFHNSSPQYMFLQKSLQHNSWLLLCFSAVYITLGLWLCTPKREQDVSLAFLQSICSLLQIPPAKFLTLPLIRLRFLNVLLFVLGFCVSNMYVTKMASYLTATSHQVQINNMQDLIDAKLNVMMLDFEYNYILEMKLNITPGFTELIIPVSKSVMDKHRLSLNTSYGYSVTTDTWDFLNQQQRFLKKPLFHLTSICIGPFFYVFPLQKDSYLMQPLKDFILDVSQNGIIFFWKEEAFTDALFLGYVQMFKNDNEFTALSIDFFRSICYVWLFGLLLAAVTFVLEIKRVSMGKISAGVGKLLDWLIQNIYEL